MSEHLLTELTIFILAVFVGIEVISKVPTTLHTPLMSATNAIHGIVLVGAILVAGSRIQARPVPLHRRRDARIAQRVRRLHRHRRMLQMFKPRATPPAKGDGKR